MRFALLGLLVACGNPHEATKPSIRASAEQTVGPAAVPDAQPITRSPREQGPSGPRVAWSLAAHVTEPRELFVAWTAGGSLVVKDDDGVRLVRGGKVAWAAPVSGSHSMLVGNMYVGEYEQEDELVTLDLGSRSIRTIPIRDGIAALGAGVDTVLVRTRAGAVYELAPATCSKPTCLARIATLGNSPITNDLSQWRDAVVAADNDRVLVADRRGTKLEVEFSSGNNNTTVDGDEVLVVDNTGVAILSLPGCSKRGRKIAIASMADSIDGCIIAHQPEDWTGALAPVRLPGGDVAYNQLGDEEGTRLFGPGVTWSVATGGAGDVIGDARFVYVVTLGTDYKGPVRLLALARANGHVAWQTDLVAVPPADPYVTLALRGHQLVVGVGPKLYGITTN